MSQTSPTPIDAPPTAPITTSPSTFSARTDAFLAWFSTLVTQVNALATNVYNNAVDCYANAVVAAAAAVSAVAAAASAAATSNVTKWVSGTTYTAGECVWSPIDFLTYRRQANGGGTIDPSADSSHWTRVIPSSGITSVRTAVTTSTTLTVSDAPYVPVAMASLGQSVTAPDATTLTVGQKLHLDGRTSGYPFGFRDSTGTLIMGAAAGGQMDCWLTDNSTAAGVWSVTGVSLEPGLITIDNTFSATYASSANAVTRPFVTLDNDKSIHCILDSSNHPFVYAVDNATKAVGTPVQVSASAFTVKALFKITSTTALLFYGNGNDILYGVVISLSGATTLAVGTATNSGSQTYIAVEDFYSAPKIAQLDTTLYLVSWATATGAGNTSVMGIQVNGGTSVTFGSKVDLITSNNIVNSTTTYKLTTTTALVLYKSGASVPYANSGVVVSVTNANPPVCSAGTPAALTNVASSLTGPPNSCLLSATKCIVSDDNNTAGSVIASVFTISAGTTVTAGTLVSVETGIAASSSYTTDGANRYVPHIWAIGANTAGFWYADSSSVSRVVILSESAGTVTKGTILYNSIYYGSSQKGYMQQQGTTEFVAMRTTGGGQSGIHFLPHKISGTAISVGIPTAAETDFNGSVAIVNTTYTRLSSGDYVLQGCTADASTYKHPVFRSNGDFIRFKGAISGPDLSLNAAPIPYALSSNRVAWIGTTIAAGSAIDAGATWPLRITIAEIAA